MDRTITHVTKGRAATARRLERAMGTLSTAAIQRMDEGLPWYRSLPPDDRSWVGLVVQAGLARFVEWFRDPDERLTITADVFGTAPRELARVISLRRTVDLVRLTIDVVEQHVDEIASPGEEAMLREAVLLYSREIAFAAAQVYAQAAEARGAWDARIEALVVDALLRGEIDDGVRSRAAALGWSTTTNVCVVMGSTPDASPDSVAEAVQRLARHEHLDAIVGVQGQRLVVVLGRVSGDPVAAARALLSQFGPGPVVVGPVTTDLTASTASAAAALSGLRAAAAWFDAPRPAHADDLLPERALDGDPNARARLVDEVFGALASAGGELLQTVGAFLEQSGSMEGAARLLFVHPNTVRYRLRRVADVTGVSPTDPRGAFTLRVALTLGRLNTL